MSARDDFIEAYTTVFPSAREFADGLLRQVETDYADTENRQLQGRIDQIAVEHMQSQDVLALRKQVDELKSREAAARDASAQLAGMMGHGDVGGLLQAGRYEQALALLRERITAKEE